MASLRVESTACPFLPGTLHAAALTLTAEDEQSEDRYVLLAIDVGNSQVKFGLFDGQQLVTSFRLETRAVCTADEYAAQILEQLTLKHIASLAVTQSALCSVVPHLTQVIVDAVRCVFGCSTPVVGVELPIPMPNHYEPRTDVGIDRLVTAFAAYRHVAGGASSATRTLAVIVVDLGTATKFDCVSQEGEFLGGIIAPGMQIGLDALAQRAAKLRSVPLEAPPHALGRNTVHALQSGVVLGHVAMIEGLLGRLQLEMSHPCRVLITGGLAPVIAEHLTSQATWVTHLTLTGLCQLALGA